jgi:hypothetical protein
LKKAAGVPITARQAARHPTRRRSSSKHNPAPSSTQAISAGTKENKASGSDSNIATGG